MRTLALDVGTRTIGVAISDPLGIIAQPVTTIRRTGRAADTAEVMSLVTDREVGCVVVGLPLRQDATEGDSAKEARRMVAAIEKAIAAAGSTVPVVMQDERYTTAQAERSLIKSGVRRKKRKKVIDQVAAVLILQGHLAAGGLR
jgi:putative Holliday junction resolvase